MYMSSEGTTDLMTDTEHRQRKEEEERIEEEDIRVIVETLSDVMLVL